MRFAFELVAHAAARWCYCGRMIAIRAFRLLATAFLVSVAACSSEGKVGESCDESGKTDGECESGAICGKDTDGSQICLHICSEQTECGTDKDCNGVEGSSLKACRPKENPLGTGGTK